LQRRCEVRHRRILQLHAGIVHPDTHVRAVDPRHAEGRARGQHKNIERPNLAVRGHLQARRQLLLEQRAERSRDLGRTDGVDRVPRLVHPPRRHDANGRDVVGRRDRRAQ
jgi:hypothetical protein